MFRLRFQFLSLSSCAISSLGEGISRLPHLHTLHINSNSFSSSSLAPLCLLPSLTDLDISGNAMVTLPSTVACLTQLHSLRIRGMGLYAQLFISLRASSCTPRLRRPPPQLRTAVGLGPVFKPHTSRHRRQSSRDCRPRIHVHCQRCHTAAPRSCLPPCRYACTLLADLRMDANNVFVIHDALTRLKGAVAAHSSFLQPDGDARFQGSVSCIVSTLTSRRFLSGCTSCRSLKSCAPATAACRPSTAASGCCLACA